ncbi:hypothetical protein D3C83_294020 [compost metagenome]
MRINETLPMAPVETLVVAMGVSGSGVVLKLEFPSNGKRTSSEACPSRNVFSMPNV